MAGALGYHGVNLTGQRVPDGLRSPEAAFGTSKEVRKFGSSLSLQVSAKLDS